jgi:hypothetical protein
MWACWGGAVLLSALLIRAAIYESIREPPDYTQIEDGLFLGARVRQPPPGTQAVLNLCEHEDAYTADVHRWEPIHDAAPAPTLDWLRDQVDFVEEQRRAGRTAYVHCLNGVSRSGMVVVAYLMQSKGWSRDEALSYVRLRRPGVRPHPAFMELLLDWERHLNERGDADIPAAEPQSKRAIHRFRRFPGAYSQPKD